MLISLFLATNVVLGAIDYFSGDREKITWLQNALFALFFTGFYSLRYLVIKKSNPWHKDYKKKN